MKKTLFHSFVVFQSIALVTMFISLLGLDPKKQLLPINMASTLLSVPGAMLIVNKRGKQETDARLIFTGERWVLIYLKLMVTDPFMFAYKGKSLTEVTDEFLVLLTTSSAAELY